MLAERRARALYDEAQGLEAEGRLERAVHYYQQAADLDENFSAAHLAVGFLSGREGELPHARRALQRAVEILAEKPVADAA